MAAEEILYDIECVPDTFYEEARENIVMSSATSMSWMRSLRSVYTAIITVTMHNR